MDHFKLIQVVKAWKALSKSLHAGLFSQKGGHAWKQFYSVTLNPYFKEKETGISLLICVTKPKS